jgi:hypothetical protein
MKMSNQNALVQHFLANLITSENPTKRLKKRNNVVLDDDIDLKDVVEDNKEPIPELEMKSDDENVPETVQIKEEEKEAKKENQKPSNFFGNVPIKSSNIFKAPKKETTDTKKSPKKSAKTGTQKVTDYDSHKEASWKAGEK